VISKVVVRKLLQIKRLQKSLYGRLSHRRLLRQKQRWFWRGQGWIAGIEARLSTLKHRFGMQRARYKGEIGLRNRSP
jgi:hypothetical protein